VDTGSGGIAETRKLIARPPDMFIYLFLFSIIGFFAIEVPPLTARTQRQMLGAFCFSMWLVASTRYKVGGDWYQYVDHFVFISQAAVKQSLDFFEPGWVIVNRLSAILETGVYGVNAIVGFISLASIYLLCRSVSRPLLGLVVSFPYMYIVVIMGFVRQSVAMGFFALAIYVYQKKQPWYVAAAVCALGLLFHSTAIFAVMFIVAAALLKTPDGALSKPRLFFFLFLQVVLLYYYVSRFGMGDKYESYSSYDYNPAASRMRSIYNLCIFALWPKARDTFDNGTTRVLGDVCLYASIAGFIGVWFIPLIFDRLIIYFLPLHILILGNVQLGRFSGLFRKGLVLLFGGYLAVWLMYANNASSWVPYQSILEFGHFFD
jgi:hypothetical protein